MQEILQDGVFLLLLGFFSGGRYFVVRPSFLAVPVVVLAAWQRPRLFPLRSMGLGPRPSARPPASQPEDREVRRDAHARCTQSGSSTENKKMTQNKFKSSLSTRVHKDGESFSLIPLKAVDLFSGHRKNDKKNAN